MAQMEYAEKEMLVCAAPAGAGAQNMVHAELKILLERQNGGQYPVALYGKIAAYADNSEEEIVLFDRRSDYAVKCSKGKPIPLSINTVDVNSSLKVKADLKEVDSSGSANTDIAYGTVVFPAQYKGTSKANIYGTKGMISVKITWTEDN